MKTNRKFIYIIFDSINNADSDGFSAVTDDMVLAKKYLFIKERQNAIDDPCSYEELFFKVVNDAKGYIYEDVDEMWYSMTIDDIMEIFTPWLHDQIEYFPTNSKALTKIGVSIEKLDAPYNKFYSDDYRIAAEVPCLNGVNKYHEEDGQKYCILEPVDAEYYEEQYDEIVKKYNIDDNFTTADMISL